MFGASAEWRGTSESVVSFSGVQHPATREGAKLTEAPGVPAAEDLSHIKQRMLETKYEDTGVDVLGSDQLTELGKMWGVERSGLSDYGLRDAIKEKIRERYRL